MDRVKVLTLSKENKEYFTTELLAALHEKFGDEIPENYGYDKPWSLMSLIESDMIDTYRLVYVNDVIWSGSGGMIREFQGEKVYQAGFRTFSAVETKYHGLGAKTHTHDHSLKYQYDRAKLNNCTKFIFSYNDYNIRLFKVMARYTLPRAFGDKKIEVIDKLTEFNGTPQYLIIIPVD